MQYTGSLTEQLFHLIVIIFDGITRRKAVQRSDFAILTGEKAHPALML
jgi:hypothetical protein